MKGHREKIAIHKPRREAGTDSSLMTQKEPALLMSGFQTPNLQNRGAACFSCSAIQFVVLCYGN